MRINSRADLLVPLEHARDRTRFGSKATLLSHFARKGYLVPKAYVCPFDVQRRYLESPDLVLGELEENLGHVLVRGRSYCVRSSADVEDGVQWSFAGQFDTFLDLTSVAQIVESVRKVWRGVERTSATEYASRAGSAGRFGRVAPVVQEMIHPTVSGVVFTRNPVTGLDETVIELVHGLGVSIMQGGVTPSRWVWKWGRCRERGEGRDESLVLEIVRQARVMARDFGRPLDIEWAFDGQKIHWLQFREITSVRGVGIYSNRIAREQLPGLIKPLVWSVNIPVVCGAWKRILVQLLGKPAESIEVNRLARSFCFRAYYNMGIVGDAFELLGMPREATELMMGMETVGPDAPRMRPGSRSLRYLPRFVLFSLRMAFFDATLRRFMWCQWRRYEALVGPQGQEKVDDDIPRSLERLKSLAGDGAYYLIVAELLLGLYTMLLKRSLGRRGLALDGSSFGPVAALTAEVDPREHLVELAKRDARPGDQAWAEFLRRFGHLSDSGNDFSRPTWREQQSTLMTMVATAGTTSAAMSSGNVAKRGGRPGLLAALLLQRAITYRVFREHVNYCYTYGYGLFRPYFLRAGARLQERGLIDDMEDVFFLEYHEVVGALKGTGACSELAERAAARRAAMRSCEDIDLPEVIIGEETPAPVDTPVLKVLEGVGVARGRAEGPARIVDSLSQSGAVKDGDILVIPFSDVSWTPLFSRVAGIVSESGGVLSHCSIVAREYGIPAVVSVAGAMKHLAGARVHIDGTSGVVQVLSCRTETHSSLDQTPSEGDS